MSNCSTETRNTQNDKSRNESFERLDTGWAIELTGAVIAWLIDEPIIAILALAAKGLLQYYPQYLNNLSRSNHVQHITVCNTLLGCGLLTALPTMVTGSPFQWLLATLIGMLLAWIILLTTGCLPSLRSQAVYAGI